jgi:cobalt-zinc-cadmium efflux system membrane fusion protein
MRETFLGVPELVWVGMQAICATSGIVGLFFILHLHGRNWVYVPTGTGNFRRVAVEGDMLSGGTQEIKSGLDIGQQVVSNALTLQNAADQQ